MRLAIPVGGADMPPSPLTRRVRILEEKVEHLEQLPARIDAIELQILQLRDEVRVEFSATRESLESEMQHLRGGLRGEMQQLRDGLRGEMQQLHAQAIARIALSDQALLHEMGQLDERAASRDTETRRVIRVLYEDLIDRIATLGEGSRRPE